MLFRVRPLFGGRRRRQASTSRRPSSARPSVSSSAYSRSPPTGRPLAMRVVFSPSGLSEPAEVHGRGLALDVRVGAEDHLGDALRLDAGQQLLDPQLVGADALDRADRALQHVVAAVELAGLLDRHEVPGLLDDAQQRCGRAGRRRRSSHSSPSADVEAPRAPAHPVRGLADRRASRRASSAGSLQQVERDALRGLRARRRGGVRARRSGPGPDRRRRPSDLAARRAGRRGPRPRAPSIDSWSSRTWDIASCSAARTRSWSISTIVGVDGARGRSRRTGSRCRR